MDTSVEAQCCIPDPARGLSKPASAGRPGSGQVAGAEADYRGPVDSSHDQQIRAAI